MENQLLYELYRTYADEIALYLYSLCKDRTVAEDLLQEVFLKAMLSLPSDHANFRAWLYRVARNMCYNEMRGRKREDDRTIAYVFFDHILSFDELLTLKKETDIWMAWNLVDTHGVRNDGEGWSSASGGQFGYWDAYGFRSEGEFFRDGEGGAIQGAEPTVRVLPEGMSYEEYQGNEELQTAKMIELLEYMGQQEKFLAMVGEDPAWYRDAAEYVNQHGMQFMGIAVYGSRETLQKLLDHPLVSMVTLEQE